MRLSYLNALRALEATLRLGSFTKAAEELGVTSAAVGQQIRSLEARIDAKLFDRTNPTSRPLETALRVQDRLSLHMSGLAEVLRDLSEPKDETRLSITLPASFAENWFARRLPEFWRTNPQADLRLNASNRMADLYREGFDFALRFCGPVTGDLEVLDLFGDFVLPVCTPGFAERFGLSDAGVSLNEVPLVHLDDRTPDASWADWDIWLERFGFSISNANKALRYREVNSGLSAAKLEQGLVLAGFVEAFDALNTGELVAPFGLERNCPTEFRYRLVWPRASERSGVRRAFVDWIEGEAVTFRATVERMMSGCGDDEVS